VKIVNLADLILGRKGLRKSLEYKMFMTGLSIVTTLVVIAVLAPYIVPWDPYKPAAEEYIPPFTDPRYPLGTNFLGYDVLSRVIWGTRNSLLVAFLAVMIAASVGIPLGLLSGYVGGYIDRALSLIMDSVYAFPGIILAIALAFVLGPGIVNVAIAIAVIYVPTYFRVIRACTLVVREQLFVEAAKAMGADFITIMRYYVAPNVLTAAIPVLALNFADAILTEAGLSFLGVGLPPTEPDWGVDVSAARGDIVRGIWWTTFFPGIMIFVATLGFTLIGEGLPYLLNPRQRGRIR